MNIVIIILQCRALAGGKKRKSKHVNLSACVHLWMNSMRRPSNRCVHINKHLACYKHLCWPKQTHTCMEKRYKQNKLNSIFCKTIFDLIWTQSQPLTWSCQLGRQPFELRHMKTNRLMRAKWKRDGANAKALYRLDNCIYFGIN